MPSPWAESHATTRDRADLIGSCEADEGRPGLSGDPWAMGWGGLSSSSAVLGGPHGQRQDSLSKGVLHFASTAKLALHVRRRATNCYGLDICHLCQESVFRNRSSVALMGFDSAFSHESQL